MFGAISKLRKQIDAEIKALNELSGNGIVAAAAGDMRGTGRGDICCFGGRGYVANLSVNMDRASEAKLVLAIGTLVLLLTLLSNILRFMCSLCSYPSLL